MRVLYVSKASRVAAHRDKVAALSRHVDVTLVVPERWGRAPLEAWDEGPRPLTLPALLHGHNHFHLYRGLGGVLVPGAYDLVHIDEEPHSLVTAQFALRSMRLGVPSLFFAWQNLEKRLPPPFGTVRRAVFGAVSGGLAGTETAARVLRRAGYVGPLAVVPQMGVDPGRFRPSAEDRGDVRTVLSLPDDALVVGFAGRLAPEKGVDVLLAALARVPVARALVIGEGPERAALEARAIESDIAKRVRFVGAVPSLEMPRWLAALDVLVLPSRSTRGWQEQFGRVLVEAMACEVPVVGSDSGEIGRVIGAAGCLVPEGDVGALAATLRELAEDAGLREHLGSKGRARVLELYTQERVARDTVAFYERILGGARAEPASVRAAEGVV
ncbi:MAG TPA: glycosyltransferase family 4 protein [Candidatus Thermoplasmatota archaeon]